MTATDFFNWKYPGDSSNMLHLFPSDFVTTITDKQFTGLCGIKVYCLNGVSNFDKYTKCLKCSQLEPSLVEVETNKYNKSQQKWINSNIRASMLKKIDKLLQSANREVLEDVISTLKFNE